MVATMPPPRPASPPHVMARTVLRSSRPHPIHVHSSRPHPPMQPPCTASVHADLREGVDPLGDRPVHEAIGSRVAFRDDRSLYQKPPNEASGNTRLSTLWAGIHWHVPTHAHTCMHTCVHTCMHTCMRTLACAHLHAHVRARARRTPICRLSHADSGLLASKARRERAATATWREARREWVRGAAYRRQRLLEQSWRVSALVVVPMPALPPQPRPYTRACVARGVATRPTVAQADDACHPCTRGPPSHRHMMHAIRAHAGSR